jgi:hypothetical protein
MNKAKSFLQKISFSESSAPVALFVLCALSFGLLVPRLGFYMDDWHYVFYARTLGAHSLSEMLTYDSRPGAAWLYTLAFTILGSASLNWQVFNFLLVCGAAITYWLLLRRVLSGQTRRIVQASLLFAVYPFFMLYSSPVGYAHLWFGLLSFNVSMILMSASMSHGGYKKWLLILPALLLEAAHLFTSEYFAGLELVRIVILWILIARSENTTSRRFSRVVLNWLPYLAVLALFFFWRVAVYQNPEGVTRNEPVILMQLTREPLKALFFLFTALIKDAASVLTIGWRGAADVGTLDFSSPYFLFKLAVCVLGFGLAFFYLRKLSDPGETEDAGGKKNAAALALAALMTGGLPVWFIGRTIIESKNLLSASRFGIPSMFGAALLTALLAEYFIADKNRRALFLALLLALAINFHYDNSREFQYSWEKQNRFAQQLLWRAPGIEPGTALLTDQEVMGVMGEYAVSFSINTMYRVEDFGRTPPYWYFAFLYTNPNVGDLLQGFPLEYKKLSMEFKGSSRQMLLLDFNPEMKRCLWVLQPQDTNLRLVSDDVRRLAAGSDIGLIEPSGKEASPPEDIYGKQDTQTWCYYFEKADLARQYGQWDEIVRLWNEAQSVGERADNGFEYIPFIEGLGHTGDWEQARTLIRFANRITSGLQPSLCSALDRLAENAPASPQRDETIINLKDDLSCRDYQ